MIEIIVEKDEPSGNPVVAALALNSMVVAQQSSALSDLCYANQVSSNDVGAKSQVANQDAMNRLRQAILANAVTRVQDLGAATARASVAVLTSNALAQEIADLKAAVEAFASQP
jgi:hypothetical protein